MKKIALIAIASLLSVGIAAAGGQKNGFGKDETKSVAAGQGNTAKPNANANPGNNGQTVTETTETTTGPRGQLKNAKTDCNNCETTVTTEVIDKPGKKK